MNVTRDVMTDLLPVYFSGEASEDTKQLVEIYFRENPDFERIERGAAIPLEQLRGTAPVRAEAEREKCDLQWARKEFFRRRMFFAMALFFTCARPRVAGTLLVFRRAFLVSLFCPSKQASNCDDFKHLRRSPANGVCLPSISA
jgi:hypothetical protein